MPPSDPTLKPTGRTKTVWKIWFSYDERQQTDWLTEQSRQGWHLIEGGLFRYRFEKGSPKNYLYRFDYRWKFRGNDQDYYDLCKDAGWTPIFCHRGWHGFRIDADVHPNAEFFNYPDDVAAKYQRALRRNVVLIVAISAAAATGVLLNGHLYNAPSGLIPGVIGGFLAVSLASIWVLYWRIRQIRMSS
ncbi:MAG: DUF2812 domain-containing protein [Maricaulaceae bacterium]